MRGFGSSGWSDADWSVASYGPPLSALPTGDQTYKGGTLALPQRQDYDGRKGEGEVFYRPFTMSVNFGTGTGNIGADTTTALTTDQIDLIGAFTVDLATGTFSVETGDTINIEKGTSSGKDTLPANLYGTFHGPTGEGVTGVFYHAIDDPTVIGGILGSKQ